MILFPNAKINLGLNVTNRRPDGYHDLLTVMIPIPLCDILEIVPGKSNTTTLHTSGRSVNCPPEKNLVIKAYRALANHVGDLPPVDIFLEKIIPDGAGMGGGSADAAFTIRGLNELFKLNIPDEQLAKIAAEVGADCPFFIYNKPAYCTGIGTDVSLNVSPSLTDTHIAIAKPKSGVISTAEAYSKISPKPAIQTPRDIVAQPVEKWKDDLYNDFEPSVFTQLPRCKELKELFYEHGAIYSAMSGSGAAVFGIFRDDKMAQESITMLNDCDTFTAKLG